MRSEPRGARTPVWAPPVSLAATPGIDVSFFSSGYLDVSVHRVPPARLCIHHAVAGVLPAGFPHSDTHGSVDICSSPWLFAACRVFLRLSVPRHPPCALSCLTIIDRGEPPLLRWDPVDSARSPTGLCRFPVTVPLLHGTLPVFPISGRAVQAPRQSIITYGILSVLPVF